MPNTKMCLKCKEVKELKYFRRNGTGNICYRCSGIKERSKLKYDMLVAFGFSCQCCGESNPYFLTLDHINNDGNSARDKYNEQQIYRLARQEGWPKDKYQLLCMNCNFAKGHYGECPHKQNLTNQQILDNIKFLSEGIGHEHVIHNTNNLPEARKVLAQNRTFEKAKNMNVTELIEFLKKQGVEVS
jgi:hypothetical protein